MPQLVKKRRSGWAVLATGALVASLLAVGASPVGADIDVADNTADTAACVGGALGDQMFTDVSDEHAFKDAINCVAYYGVTNGTGDGSTYSPNDDVTRAQMAVFIARAAGVAGVDLGDAMGDEFSDLDGVWQEARDAINQLADKGIIAGGGAFRPDDAINRAEMASFLVGLLAAASPMVTIDSNGAIKLGDSGSGTEADDHFGDVRASLPVSSDKETAALWELGITKGASAAAGAEDGQAPLDSNYEPDGTVNRGEMAAFITRALAHTSVRPAGISAQYDGSDVVLSARDENFQPMSNVVIDTFRIETSDVDLAFRANGSCGETSKISAAGTYGCEIDGADPITGGDGDTSVALDGGVDSGGTTVWAWTGDNEDAVDGDTDLFRLDIPEGADTKMADRVRVSTEFAGAKAHLGSSVLFTVQLEDSDGSVTVGADGKKPAKFLVTLSTTAIVPVQPATDPPTYTRNPQGASVVTTLPLTTDADGKATFSASGLPAQAPGLTRDQYVVDIMIQAAPDGNLPADPSLGVAGTSFFYIGANATAATDDDATGRVVVRGGAGDADYTDDPNDLVFSTEASSRASGTVVVSVKPAADHVVASARGASARATVSVVDQYGDPIPGARVSLSSSIAGVTIGGGRALAVGRDGTYTFGYERAGAGADAAATETLTPRWDHDNDGCHAAAADVATDCADITDATAGIDGTTGTVEWAVPASTDQTDQAIRGFDTETNTIFAGVAGTVWMITYDSNDRFDLGPAASETASNYAAFERALKKDLNLDWDITGTGSRAINIFTLSTS